MAESKSLKAVPLPEVPQYTDAVVFGGLGLPVGFDEERLLVNLTAFDRVRAVAGLGTISMSIVSGESLDVAPQINGVSTSGAALLGAAVKQDKRGMTQGTVRFPSNSTTYDYPDAILRIDAAAFDQKLEAVSGDAGVNVRDPKPRATVLNKAVRSGLLEASKDANFDLQKAKITAMMYGWFYSMGVMAGNGLEHSAVTTALISPIAPIMNNLASVKLGLEKGYPILDILSRLRQSYFVGLTPDRYLAAAAIIGSSRFIRAAK